MNMMFIIAIILIAIFIFIFRSSEFRDELIGAKIGS